MLGRNGGNMTAFLGRPPSFESPATKAEKPQ